MRTPAIIERSLGMPCVGPPVMSTGSQWQNTLCITSQAQASVSRILGNLDAPEVCIDHEAAASEMIIWQGRIPAAVACNLDPDFYSTSFAIEMGTRLGVPYITVQHHHAHIAAICVEHRLNEAVIGLVLDDRGLGTDGNVWGGELLLVDGKDFTRLGHLSPIAMPGGGIAVQEPWRMGSAVLHGLKRGNEIATRYQHHGAAVDLATMLAEERNCPVTSSACMMIRAAAELLRLCPSETAEANAGVALENAAMQYYQGDYAPVPQDLWQIDAAGQLDLYPLFSDLADEANGERGAAIFHASLIAGATEWVAEACNRHGIGNVVLGGSCFINRLLSAGLRDNLSHRGFAVFEAQALLPDDSAVSLGQAWIALQQLKAG